MRYAIQLFLSYPKKIIPLTKKCYRKQIVIIGIKVYGKRKR